MDVSSSSSSKKCDKKLDKAIIGDGKDEELEMKLVKAAMDGDVGVLNRSNLSDEHLFRKSCEKNNIIHIAVRYGKIEFLEAFLKKYFDINKKLITEKNSQGNTPLHVAAEVGNLGIVKLLYDYLKLKKSIEGHHDDKNKPWTAKNSQGNTAVHVALLYHNFHVVRSLLKQDRGFARIVNKSKEAPLHLAITQALDFGSGNKLQIIRNLLSKARCVASWPDGKGMTPLHRAASLNPPFNLQITTQIIQFCPESTLVSDASGKSILHHLANKIFGNTKIEDLLGIPEIYILRNHQDQEGNTPLHIAAKCNNINMVKVLMRSSAKPHIKNRDGISAVSVIQQQDFHQPLERRSMTKAESSACKGNIGILSEKMRFSGIDFLASQDSEKRNVLHLLMNTAKVTRLYVKNLLNFIKEALQTYPLLVCQIDQTRDTPLHILARNKNLSEVMSLRQSDFFSNLLSICVKALRTIKPKRFHNNEADYSLRPWVVQNGDDNTPLHEAIIAKNNVLVLGLLSYSEETSLLVNKHKETPLHLLAGTSISGMKEFKVEDILMKFVKANFKALGLPDKDGLTPISRAVKVENINMVVILLRSVKNFGDIIDDRTFWHLLLQCRSKKFVNGLLQEEAFLKMLEQKDKHGNTPLLLAMKEVNNLDLATILCSKAPEAAKMGDIDGRTFWHLLLKHPSYKPKDDNVKDLLQIEALRKELERRDKDENTPLHLAIKEKHFDFVELLLETCERESKLSEVDRLLIIPNNLGETPEDLLADLPTLSKELENKLLNDRRMRGIRSSWRIPRTQLENYMNSMNVIAALQTTITFTAAFTVPGGLIEDIGTPILIRRIAFQAFMISDVIAMCLSVMVLICLLWMVATDKRKSVMIQDFALWLLLASFVATLLTFMTGVYATISPVKPWIAIFTLVLCSLLCSLLVLLFPRCVLTKLLLLFKSRKVRFVKIKCMCPNDGSNTQDTKFCFGRLNCFADTSSNSAA